MIVLLAVIAFPAPAAAEQASQPDAPAAGRIDVSGGGATTCAVLDDNNVRCWGFGADGRPGYANTETIGDNETPASAGPVDLSPPGGPQRSAKALSVGTAPTCALLDDASVRCWGFGGDGRLGYANTETIGDNETPGSAGPVYLGPTGGPQRSAKAISAGGAHSCAVLDDDSVRCWGFGGDGRLGYGNTEPIGDNETPGPVGPVDLSPPGGPQRSAKAISAGQNHTCALLDDNSVRCWGVGATGRLGYGNTDVVGDN
ncbi:MAG: chromosome condensation regulator, partial [Thermoleophilaceae bacterium]|nr:chromosome condensation regulator [Thermoleophilaceae bacterium]